MPYIAGFRQYRLNSLDEWCVAEILVVLSMLCQISLSPVFSRMLALPWNLHLIAIIFGSRFVGIVTSMVGMSLPSVVLSDYCYISPPTRPHAPDSCLNAAEGERRRGSAISPFPAYTP